jgi:hypothetical protein
LRNPFKDRTALANGFVRAQHHGKGAEHEHDGAPRCGFREHVGSAARTESGLAASAAERASEIRGFAALKQNDHNQHKTIGDEKCWQHPEEPARIRQSPSCHDNSSADQ